MNKIVKLTSIGVFSAICGISIANGQINSEADLILNQPIENINTGVDNTNIVPLDNTDDIPADNTENNDGNPKNNDNDGTPVDNRDNGNHINDTETSGNNNENNNNDGNINNTGNNGDNTDTQTNPPDEKIAEKIEIKILEESEKVVFFREDITKQLTEEEKEIIINKIKEKNPDLPKNTKITIGKINITFEFEDGSNKEFLLKDFVLFFDHDIQAVTIFKNKKLAQRMKDEIKHNIIQSNPNNVEVLSIDDEGNATIKISGITKQIDARDLTLEINLPDEVIVQDKKNLTPEEKQKVLSEVIRANKNIIKDTDNIDGLYDIEKNSYNSLTIEIDKKTKNHSLNGTSAVYSIHFAQDREEDTKQYVLDKPVNNVANYNEIVILLDTHGSILGNFMPYIDNVVTADFLKDFLIDEEDIRKRQEEEEKKRQEEEEKKRQEEKKNTNTGGHGGGIDGDGGGGKTTNTVVTTTPESQPKVDEDFFIREEEIKTTEVLETFLIKENEKYQKILLLYIDKNENNENFSEFQTQETQNTTSTKTSKFKLPERLPETGFSETILALMSMLVSAIILKIKKYSHK